MKSDKDIWSTMARYLAGEMNPKEEISFRSDIKNNNKLEELEEMEARWKYFSEDNTGNSPDTGRAWQDLYSRLEKDGLLEQSRKRKSWHLNPYLRVAATIVLVLALGIPSIFLLSKKEESGTGFREQIAGKGVSTVDLPDGSRVFLNKGTKISYPEDFEMDRSVKLEGEAFFEVMSDPVNPFTVRSGKVVVSVLGTSFNVKGADSSDDVEVFVESGKVRMGLENTGKYILLTPGELGRTDKKKLSSLDQSDANYLSWKTKDFKFVNEDLDKVLLVLEASYHVEIHVDAQVLEDKRLTSGYREQSIDSILETIGTAFGLNIKKEENQYYLEP